ncbi:superoxide dismutase family protein [Gracilimonas mengyeensis]|uniref:Superoxide dismutase, Cu-Zn family n=1 Tax=Gracilimonas mengyeensis TaxID=1302730 RepID=A0A521EGI5_9BACT|nr:superoxide dismutase family protein [Gracilimonas mengyeensis]SMO83023.1 superoxide dismutase, Cu-Zn family [Gracilimonas mengyeensis]
MRFLTFVFAAALFAVGCTETQTVEKEVVKTVSEHDFDELTATVMAVGESGVSGTVTFTKANDGVQVQGNFAGLEPGMHGFHIHQYGDCSADDGTSAGGHFNPAGNDHAAPTDSSRHMGDLGNLEANENGEATIDYTDSVIDMSQILGRGLIIHAGEDDLTSQPTGAAGSRLACGVIGVAQGQ